MYFLSIEFRIIIIFTNLKLTIRPSYIFVAYMLSHISVMFGFGQNY